MTVPPAVVDRVALEAALRDVHSTLAELLVAADEQFAAVTARDPRRLESVTRQQERLSSQLARAETRRLELLAGKSLADALAGAPARETARLEVLRTSIAQGVQELKRRHTQTASLLEQSIELAGQTLNFLQRLVTVHAPVYGAHGMITSSRSVLVDGRA